MGTETTPTKRDRLAQSIRIADGALAECVKLAADLDLLEMAERPEERVAYGWLAACEAEVELARHALDRATWRLKYLSQWLRDTVEERDEDGERG